MMNPTVAFILAYSLLTIATALFLWALAWDHLMLRFNRRPTRRCPKCWYNLTYTPSKTCSECGYNAPSEKQLHKSRKRKRGIILAILLFLAAQAAFVYPRFQKRGWIATIPNWTLIALLPQLDFDNSVMPWWLWENKTSKWTWHQQLWVELDQRVYQKDLDYFDYKLLAWRCMTGDGKRPPCSARWNDVYQQLLYWTAKYNYIPLDKLAAFAIKNANINIRIPKRWPADINVPIYINHEYWYGAPRLSISGNVRFNSKLGGFHMGTSDADASPDQYTSIEYKPFVNQSYISRQPFWKNNLQGNITFTATIKNQNGTKLSETKRTIPLSLPAPQPTPWQQIISPVNSEPLNNLIRTKVKAKIRPTRKGSPVSSPYWFQIDFTGLQQYFIDNKGPTIGLTIEILRNNKVILAGHGWIWTASPETLKPLPKPVLTNLIIEPGLAFRSYDPFANIDFKTPANWQVRLTPNPIAALENLNCNQYWQGEPITLPLNFTK